MPVQINEMVIRANVVETNSQENQSATNTSHDETSGTDKSEIIKECAALVLEIINSKNER